MTEEQAKKLDKIHDWLFNKPGEQEKSRAGRIDDLLFAVKYGKWTMRGLLWLAGAVGAAATAIAAIKGWIHIEAPK